MKTETNIQISNLRASLKGEVIGSDDPRYLGGPSTLPGQRRRREAQ
jgi:hypothetical protein